MKVKSLALFILCSLTLSAQTIQRAEALWRAHDYVGAGHEFETLLKAAPQNANYRVRYAQLLYERFNAEAAQALFAEALKLDPKNGTALLGMAQIFADSYDPKATDLAKQALEADPKLYQAHELMARTALEDDDSKKAETEADAALAIQPDALEATAIRASIDLLADKQSTWLPKIG